MAVDPTRSILLSIFSGQYGLLSIKMDARSKACLSIILHFALKRNVRRKRWVKEWLLKRDQYTHLNLLNEILITDTNDYLNYFRMSAETFQLLI